MQGSYNGPSRLRRRTFLRVVSLGAVAGVLQACQTAPAPSATAAPQDWFGYGFSFVLSPDGKVLETAKSLYGSEIVYATIPTAK